MAIIYLVFMITSATITFLSVEPMAIFRGIGLTGLEWEVAQNVPLEGIHLVFLFVLPLVITVVILASTRPLMAGEIDPVEIRGSSENET